MKRLHRKDLYCWSSFYEPLNIDFNGFAWIRNGGNVLIDPLPLSPHDQAHLRTLGGAAWIVLTNSGHVRGAQQIAQDFQAQILGPAAEKEQFPVPCDGWLSEGEERFPGLRIFEMEGSKTPGELALVLDETTLITGDLIRAHRANALMMLLPEQGLKDARLAATSIKRLSRLPLIETVLVGDGWHLLQQGHLQLERLSATLEAALAQPG